MASKHIPEIRFKGFEDGWEEKKLSSVTNYVDYRGKSPEKSRSGIQLITASNIRFGLINYEVDQQFVKESHYSDIMRRGLPEIGDVLLTTEAPLGNVAQVNKKEIALAQRVIKFSGIKDKIVNDYLFVFFLSNRFQKEIVKKSTGGTVKGIKGKVLHEMAIQFPIELSEQQKIGTFFKQLDESIDCRQQELDHLKQTKQAFLQKMFPKEGETVPEVRFKGFDGEWEEKKVSELSEETYGGGTPQTSISRYWNGKIPWIQSSDLKKDSFFNLKPKKFITEEAIKNSAAKIIPKNSITIVTRVGVGKLAFIPFEFSTSQDFLSLSKLKVNSYFGVYVLHKLIQRDIDNIQGTSIKGITKGELIRKTIKIPSIEEQQKIGTFFKQLDDKIQLHERELEGLKQTKQAFLQKMFV